MALNTQAVWGGSHLWPVYPRSRGLSSVYFASEFKWGPQAGDLSDGPRSPFLTPQRQAAGFRGRGRYWLCRGERQPPFPKILLRLPWDLKTGDILNVPRVMTSRPSPSLQAPTGGPTRPGHRSHPTAARPVPAPTTVTQRSGGHAFSKLLLS